MRCSICGIQINLVEDAVEKGWTSYFYDLDQEYELACPSCTESLLQMGEDGEMELKEEYRGKLKYLDESGEEAWQDHSQVITAVLENEPGKLN